jgi:hypothetical protein
MTYDRHRRRVADPRRTDVRAFIVVVTLFAASLTPWAPAIAQEGHPLKGSWIGSWGPSKAHSDDLLMVLNWDGKAVTGMINPGTDNIAIKTATLTPEGWVVRIEAAAKNAAYSFEGKIEDLAMHNRSISGTWKSATETGKFKIVRQ